jgi:lipoprotein-anchoring transpeptidase ErfK/SrfK
MLRVAYAEYPTAPLARAHAAPAINAFPPTAARSRLTGRRVVRFAANYLPGSIVVVNRERALYLVTADHTAIRYPVSIGNSAQQWTGLEFVTAKRVNPTWYPLAEPGRPTPVPVPGGHPDNPLGPRALYLGTTLWRIHGTSAPGSIGRAVSNGCIRMLNEDVLDLYDRISLGTEVFVVAHLAAPPPVLPGAKLAR